MKHKMETKKKGALPSTVGAMLEASIHGSFTEIADGLYASGYLNQIQRIALSSAIGTSLETFTKEAGDLSGILVQPCDVDMLMGDNEEDGSEDAIDQASPMDMSDVAMTGMMSEIAPIDSMPMTPEQKRKKMLKDKLDAQMAAEMATNISKAEAYGGVARTDLKNSDFVFPDTRTFPVKTAKDVKDAVSSWGRYKGKESFETFKANLTKIAKRLGFESSLPASWMDGNKKALQDELTGYILGGAKSLYDQKAGDHVWIGLSHNAWQDREADIIPMALIEADIVIQRDLIKSGKLSQYGYGLWQDHEQNILGDCTLREMVPGGRSCVEMGNLKAQNAGIKASTMSIGYWYGLKGGDYSWITVYERSALVETKAINARTFFSVRRREVISDAAMQKSIDELLAAAMMEE